eukprot:gnl/MRDRNA2_/MRDRNA2_125082_c0_seq1.p1 gnl/MRDRNA2_/MRDRNA2_125082_c0~~gnl/MRDRNA2_/MRDRNA2_125082_c0_seq1.p1  ORF type:complete len:750 (-),score=140.85 gnl/MRDRNA2_/MRDRNA2_125082_c0_seq1:36-2285(-)
MDAMRSMSLVGAHRMSSMQMKRLEQQERKKKANRASMKDPKYLKALKDCDVALELVADLLAGGKNAKRTAFSTLSSWLQHFDCNHDMVISFEEFLEGMSRLEYQGNAHILFRRMDIDGSGELTLDEIDPDASKLWMRFRYWCVERFDSPSHMIRQLACSGGTAESNLEDFIETVHRLGWTGGYEETLFGCISNDVQCVTPAYLGWFETDKAKQARKERARAEAVQEQAYHAKERRAVIQELQRFRAFLKKKYATFLRAWRCALDLDGSMSIQKHELFTAVKEIGFRGNVRLVWKGLDKDMSGVTSLMELDLRSAYQLAKFKEFCTNIFGSAAQAFTVFDKYKKCKLRRDDFLEACHANGFKKATPGLFHGLDWKGNQYIMAADLAFLDAWRCPLYLTCKANEKAAKEFKAALLRMYKNYIKAWRHCLDRDNSNCVAWEEFDAACRKIRFTGDLHGAWRFLDRDMNGSISFEEIDAESSDALLCFKRWADEEFGGIRSAFNVIDTDGTGALNRREWRKAMTAYGYQGDIKKLFDALDVDGQGVLTLTEISFLADWEVDQITEEDLKAEAEQKGAAEKIKLTSDIPCPLRIQELAQCKLRVPAKPDGSVCSGKISPDGDASFFLKLKPKKSPYGQILEDQPVAKPPIPSPDQYTTTIDATRIEAMKDEILRLPRIDVEPQVNDFNSVPFFDMASIKSKTSALRDRTVKLLSKVDDSDRQMSEAGLWSVTPADISSTVPNSPSKVCKLPPIV